MFDADSVRGCNNTIKNIIDNAKGPRQVQIGKALVILGPLAGSCLKLVYACIHAEVGNERGENIILNTQVLEKQKRYSFKDAALIHSSRHTDSLGSWRCPRNLNQWRSLSSVQIFSVGSVILDGLTTLAADCVFYSRPEFAELRVCANFRTRNRVRNNRIRNNRVHTSKLQLLLVETILVPFPEGRPVFIR